MAQPRRTYHYDLSKITEFNPALIYAFEPENSIRNYSEQTQMLQYLTHLVGQYEDMFQAYLYAQDTILKSIREKGVGHITPEEILTWWNGIHERIAFTLAADWGRPELAGRYMDEQVVRWHQGAHVYDILKCQFLFEQGIAFPDFIHGVGPGFTAELNKANVDLNSAKKFVAMLHKYSKLDLRLTDSAKSELSRINQSLEYQAVVAVVKVISAYHLNLLDSEERQALEKLAKVCCQPEEIPGKMKAFATKLAEAWNTCDKNNLEAVAELCRNEFAEGTDIHPVFNCTGRAATCLENVISVSLGRGSFLMRHPGEKTDPTSTYAQAIEHIDTRPELLRMHILSRLTDVDRGVTYENETLKRRTEFMFDIVKRCAEIKAEFPEDDVQKSLQICLGLAGDNFAKQIKEQKQDPNSFTQEEKVTIIFNLTIKLLSFRQTTLREAKQKASTPASPVIQRQYSAEEKQAILAKLESLTGLTGWKAYTIKNELQILLEMDTAEHSIALAKVLNRTAAVKAEQKFIAATQKPVVLLQNIHPERLAEVALLEGWVVANKTPSAEAKGRL